LLAGSIPQARQGFWQGATENSAVCEALPNDLVERGADAQQSYLFVIDGSKALRKAIREIFGTRGVVQRCQVHKTRNVLDHLPKSLQPSVGKTVKPGLVNEIPVWNPALGGVRDGLLDELEDEFRDHRFAGARIGVALEIGGLNDMRVVHGGREL
jgi:hypothetical protein